MIENLTLRKVCEKLTETEAANLIVRCEDGHDYDLNCTMVGGLPENIACKILGEVRVILVQHNRFDDDYGYTHHDVVLDRESLAYVTNQAARFCEMASVFLTKGKGEPR